MAKKGEGGPKIPPQESVVERLAKDAKIHLQSPAGEYSPVINPKPTEVDERQIGRYQVVGEVTQGSKSVILKSRDTDLGRDVAMKLIKKDLLKDPSAVQRFVEEAQVGAQLQHPGIVPVYELGLMADNRPYFTMNFVKGETLAILLARRDSAKQDQRRFLGIFEKVCHAIAYAHTRSVVHRDLRPWNIMVGEYGDVKVMDWGFAKVSARSGEPAMSRSATDSQVSIIETIRSAESETGLDGVVIGTPGYMSPEQAMGEIDRLDERADVFALGAILCEILTGFAPYRGDRVEEILFKAARARQDECHESLKKCGADRRLCELTVECLTPSKAARPRNAEEVASRFGKILTQIEADARAAQISAEEERVRALGAAKARKLTFSIAGAVLLAGVLGAGLFFWMDRSDRMAREEAARKVQTKIQEAVDLRRDAEAKPSEDAGRWTHAVATAKAARDLAESSDVDEGMKARALDLARDVEDQARTDHEVAARKARLQTLVADLTDIRAAGWEEPGLVGAGERYKEAFAHFEVDFDKLTPSQIAKELSESEEKAEVTGALDDWSRALADTGKGEESNQPLQVLRLLDPDPLRDRLRTVIARSSRGKRRGALLSFARQMPSAPPAETNMLYGSALLRSGAPEFAEEALRAAAEKAPRDFWTRFHLAAALLLRDPPALVEAVGHFTTAVALRPASTQARHALAVALSDRGSYEEATEAWKALLQKLPGDGHLTTHLGATISLAEDPVAGFTTMKNASTAAPDDPWIRNRLGVAYLAKREWAGAAREFQAALRAAPGWRTAERNWITALEGAGELQKGVARYEGQAKPGTGVEPWYLLGICLLRQGRAGEAVAAIEKAVGIDPGDADSFHALGLAHVSAGDLDKAVAAFKDAYTQRPGFGAAQRRIGLTYAQEEEFDPAMTELLSIVESHPGEAPALLDLGWLRIRMGSLPAALDSFDSAARMDESSAVALFGKGRVLSKLGRMDEAESAYRGAIGRDPNHLPSRRWFYDLLGYQRTIRREIERLTHEREMSRQDSTVHVALAAAWLAAGEPQQALETASVAVRQPNAPGETFFLRALALDTLGKNEAAGDACKKALELDPSLAEAWMLLGVTHLRAGRFEDALTALSLANLRGSNDLGWPRPAREWLLETRRMIAIEGDLEIIDSGQKKGKDAAEWLDFASLLARKGKHVRAAGLFRMAWDLGAGTFPEPSDRYADLAARSVVAAAFPAEERAEWWALVADWLKQGELSAESRQKKDRVEIARQLDRWLSDPAFAGFREPDALDAMPEEVAEEFRQLWLKIRKRLKRTTDDEESKDGGK